MSNHSNDSFGYAAEQEAAYPSTFMSANDNESGLPSFRLVFNSVVKCCPIVLIGIVAASNSTAEPRATAEQALLSHLPRVVLFGTQRRMVLLELNCFSKR